MKNIINQLVAEIDEETRQIGSNDILYLVGAPISRYMEGIAGRAKKLGLRTMFIHPKVEVDGFCVYDTETVKDFRYIRPGYDLDALYVDGLSCTAKAVMMILRQLCDDLCGRHVCVIGRGHSVKGLAEILLTNDCTVTVCHSKTKELGHATFPADVIVNSAPKTHGISGVLPAVGTIILDISGRLAVWEDFALVDYIGPQDIGRLNISILLNRFAVRSSG